MDICPWCGVDRNATPVDQTDVCYRDCPGRIETSLSRLTRPTLREQIAEIIQVKPDGPLGRRILNRIHDLGY